MNEEERNNRMEVVKEEAVKEIEMQLHEQFASNYNNGFSSTVTLFCTLLAVLYGYGYVFLHCGICFAPNAGCMYNDIGKAYYLDALVYATMVTNIVLAIMKYICLYQGVNQRYDQLIVHAIRTKYYGEDPTMLDSPKIYPNTYKPFNKKGNDIVIGLYGPIIKIIFGLHVLVTVGCLYKVVWNIIEYGSDGFIPNALIEVTFLIVVSAFCCIQYHRKKEEFKKKYKNRSMEYMQDISSDNK